MAKTIRYCTEAKHAHTTARIFGSIIVRLLSSALAAAITIQTSGPALGQSLSDLQSSALQRRSNEQNRAVTQASFKAADVKAYERFVVEAKLAVEKQGVAFDNAESVATKNLGTLTSMAQTTADVSYIDPDHTVARVKFGFKDAPDFYLLPHGAKAPLVVGATIDGADGDGSACEMTVHTTTGSDNIVSQDFPCGTFTKTGKADVRKMVENAVRTALTD